MRLCFKKKRKKKRLATTYNVIFDGGKNVFYMTFMIPTSANIKGYPPKVGPPATAYTSI